MAFPHRMVGVPRVNQQILSRLSYTYLLSYFLKKKKETRDGDSSSSVPACTTDRHGTAF